jgi:uncharacterized protein YutE (UPF0331/DUF86 family)
MDPVVFNEKLEFLRKCVNRIEAKRAPSVAALREDLDRQDILALNLTRAVQICVDIATHALSETEETVPTTMGEAFDSLEHLGWIDSNLKSRLQAAVGFRNVAVHNYQQINWDIVQAITWQHLEDFRAFAYSISQQLDNG